jgi:hypothetical protein
MLNPTSYVATGAAHEDGAWVTLLSEQWAEPLRAAVREVAAHLDVEVSPQGWRVVETASAREVCDEVAVTLFSSGTDFVFEPRRSLPLC